MSVWVRCVLCEGTYTTEKMTYEDDKLLLAYGKRTFIEAAEWSRISICVIYGDT